MEEVYEVEDVETENRSAVQEEVDDEMRAENVQAINLADDEMLREARMTSVTAHMSLLPNLATRFGGTDV